MPTPTWAHYAPAETKLVRDLDVAYRRKGEGEPLIYLHGAGLTRRWLPLYDELARHFDVIVPEHPGFGDTPRPAWLSDFSDLVLHYRDLLDAFELDRVHLVGHSLGGWIAAELAAFYPERLRSLTLIAPGGLRPQEEDGPVVDMFRLGPEDGLQAILGPDGERWLDVLDEGDPVEAAVKEYDEAITAALLSWNPRYSVKLERRLARVDVPAQVLVPQEERLLPRSIGRRYAELLPDAELITVEGSEAPTEHLLILQEPALLAERVVALAGG